MTAPASLLTDTNKTTVLLSERAARVKGALELQPTDGIPIFMPFLNLLPQLEQVSNLELYDDPERAQLALERAALRFQPDICEGIFGTPEPSRILADRMTRWPGHGLGPDGSFQYHESEYMKAEDYDAFLADPSDWAIRRYLPRVFGELAGLATLPPLAMSLMGYYAIAQLSPILTIPPVVNAFRKLQQAAQAQAEWVGRQIGSIHRMMELGFPPSPLFAGPNVSAPFDFMADTLRGMNGIFIDLRRRPEKLLAAEERVIPMLLEYATAACAARNVPHAFLPLHRGSDGFMSLVNFEKFYWPQLKQVLLGLIDGGITPVVLYEGAWDLRLQYLAELPKGKTVGIFQSTDLIKAKQVVGETMCIVGGMPNSLLIGGSAQAVREHTKLMCREVGAGGGFLMMPAVGDLQGCAPALIEAWSESVREFRST